MEHDDVASGSGAREPFSILVTLTDCVQLRERCAPLTKMETIAVGTALALFEKVAACLLRFEMETGLKTVNLPLNWEECVWINNQCHEEDYDAVHALLVQTWVVLDELKHDRPYVAPSARVELDPGIWG